ncbi:MAG: hypothetical protein WDZ69_02610 [Candidatus Pacearchaeota archaeon]
MPKLIYHQKRGSGQKSDVKNLKLYMALQIREIEEHKYYLSEIKELDVGWDEALVDWVKSKQAERFRDSYIENEEAISRAVRSEDVPTLPKDLIHKLLRD